SLPTLPPPHPSPTLFPYTTLFRSPPSPMPRWPTTTSDRATITSLGSARVPLIRASAVRHGNVPPHLTASSQSPLPPFHSTGASADRKSTRLNSSHRTISYAVFCLK